MDSLTARLRVGMRPLLCTFALSPVFLQLFPICRWVTRGREASQCFLTVTSMASCAATQNHSRKNKKKNLTTGDHTPCKALAPPPDTASFLYPRPNIQAPASAGGKNPEV